MDKHGTTKACSNFDARTLSQGKSHSIGELHTFPTIAACVGQRRNFYVSRFQLHSGEGVGFRALDNCSRPIELWGCAFVLTQLEPDRPAPPGWRICRSCKSGRQPWVTHCAPVAQPWALAARSICTRRLQSRGCTQSTPSSAKIPTPR